MLVTWIVALGLIVFAQLATRNMKQVPAACRISGNGWWEASTSSSRAFWGGSCEEDVLVFRDDFHFILFTNWFGLLPGVGTIGWGAATKDGFEVTRPLLRGGTRI